MTAVAPDDRFNLRDALMRFVFAGLATSIIDGTFASVLNVVAYGSTVARLWQGVAATLVGTSAFTGGVRTIAIGILMHCCVAFGWSAVFVFLIMRWAFVRSLLASRFGVVKVAAVYGPAIWLVMSLLVIPLLLQRATAITGRWWIQLLGHIPFVGIPIVAAASAGAKRSRNERAH